MLRILLAAALAASLSTARAQTSEGPIVRAGDLSIAKAWTRQSPPGATVGGGYLSITNTGTEPDRLVGVAAPFAPRVEIHEMAVADGVMRMSELEDGLLIPPGRTVDLAPGGYHIMFMDVTAPPAEGDTVRIVLRFERAGEVTVAMPVAAVGAPAMPGAAHGGMDHDGKETDR